MKSNKKMSLIAAIVGIALLFSSMATIGVFASDDTAAVTVDKANIAYNEMMHIALALECTEALGDGDILGILIWDDTVTGALTAENATFKNFTEKEDEKGTKYFTSYGIPAPKIADDIRIAGCIKGADGSIRLGTVITYSIVDYLNDRIATEGITPEQLNLYEKTLAYGKAAGAVFAD